MVVRHVLFATLLGSSVIAAASPADAASNSPGDGWLGWLSHTLAKALEAVGNGGEPDLGSGGEVLFDRGVSTVGSKIRRVAPALGRFDVDLELDEHANPAYGLALTQPLLHTGGRALDFEGSVGYQPDGPTRQVFALSYRRTAGPDSYRWAAGPGFTRLLPTVLTVELERHGHAVSGQTSQAVAADIAWDGLELGGGLHADQPSAGQPNHDWLQIDDARIQLTATLPRLPWAEIETRGRWSTTTTDPAQLELAEAAYLVRACPFGPLELTAGRQADGSPEPSWVTRLHLKLALGGGA